MTTENVRTSKLECHRATASVTLRIQTLHMSCSIGPSQVQIRWTHPPAQSNIVRIQRLQRVHAEGPVSHQLIAVHNVKGITDPEDRTLAFNVYHLYLKCPCLQSFSFHSSIPQLPARLRQGLTD